MRELKGDWRDLFNGFMLALDLRKMFLGFVGLAISVFAVGLYLYAIDSTKDGLVLRDPTMIRLDPAATYASDWERLVHPKTVVDSSSRSLTCTGITLAIYEMSHHILHHPNWQMRFLLPLGAGLILALIWSYLGGAIARIAAVEVARDERIETQKALHFAHKKRRAFFWAPLVCLIGFLFFAACNAVGGLVARGLDFGGHFHLGSVLVAIGLPLALLSGFIMVLILIGTALGSPLFYPAVGAEGTDSFDAISRGFSYVYSRPWHYLWYQLVSLVYGLFCVGFVWWFGMFMLKLGLKAGRLGLGASNFDPLLPNQLNLSFFGSLGGYNNAAEFHDLGLLQTFASGILVVWLFLVFGMLAGYAVSYVFSSQTMIYFLLRKKVDGIEMNEVYEEKEEELKPEGAPSSAGEASPAAAGGANPSAGSEGPPGAGVKK